MMYNVCLYVFVSSNESINMLHYQIKNMCVDYNTFQSSFNFFITFCGISFLPINNVI